MHALEGALDQNWAQPGNGSLSLKSGTTINASGNPNQVEGLIRIYGQGRIGWNHILAGLVGWSKGKFF